MTVLILLGRSRPCLMTPNIWRSRFMDHVFLSDLVLLHQPSFGDDVDLDVPIS